MVCLSVILICYREIHAYDFVIKDFIIKGMLLVPDPVYISINDKAGNF